ncbi:hypothetical protein HJG60_010821 [Phyllostomus discolor]|uniref:Uncharacterized protein n=1 Tax=Phyllostomus discolor TaxID=89673 RepID=A0A834ADI8_9CHIR|nr:hypothetical protein HJG60_010821 [Phyllostomus discolor]
MVATFLQLGQMMWSPRKKNPRVRRWLSWKWVCGGTSKLIGRSWCQTHKEYLQRLPRSKDLHQTALLLDCLQGGSPRVGPGLRLLWKALVVFYLWRVHGNPGLCMVGDFSLLATLVGPQEAKPAPASIPVLYLEELDAGSDQDAAPDQEGCPSPAVVPPPAAALGSTGALPG